MAPREVKIDLGSTSTVLPIDYQEGRSVFALFPAHLGRLKALMPTPAYVPARIAPGVGVVAVAAYEYRETSLGAYNELGIAVPLAEGGNLPGQALISALRTGRSPLYVHRLPVTTDLARDAGKIPYGFPKWTAPIEFADGPGTLTVTLFDAGRPVLELGTELPGGPARQAVLDVEVRLWDDDLPQSCLFRVQARELTQAMGRAGAAVRLHQHPIARELGSLLLSRKAFALQHMASFGGQIFAPDRLSEQVAYRLGTPAAEIARAGRPA